jgi:hypothetical protein
MMAKNYLPFAKNSTIIHATALHQELAFFYLDRAVEVCDTANGSFGYYFMRMVYCLTCYELLSEKITDPKNEPGGGVESY